MIGEGTQAWQAAQLHACTGLCNRHAAIWGFSWLIKRCGSNVMVMKGGGGGLETRALIQQHEGHVHACEHVLLTWQFRWLQTGALMDLRPYLGNYTNTLGWSDIIPHIRWE